MFYVSVVHGLENRIRHCSHPPEDSIASLKLSAMWVHLGCSVGTRSSAFSRGAHATPLCRYNTCPAPAWARLRPRSVGRPVMFARRRCLCAMWARAPHSCQAAGDAWPRKRAGCSARWGLPSSASTSLLGPRLVRASFVRAGRANCSILERRNLQLLSRVLAWHPSCPGCGSSWATSICSTVPSQAASQAAD